MSSTICLVATGISLALGPFVTLGWKHSVEKTEWQEDWRATPRGLIIEEARVKGSAAGMEPGPDAVLKNGFYRWKPELAPLARVDLRRSGATADWRLCADGACHTLGEILGRPADPVGLVVCDR